MFSIGFSFTFQRLAGSGKRSSVNPLVDRA